MLVKGTNGQVELDGGKVIIRRKGFTAFMTQGLKGDKEIPVASIASTQFKKAGLTNGYIQFGVQGGMESRGGVFAATKDENTVMFTKKQQPEFEALKAAIDAARVDFSAAPAAAAAPSAQDELLRWKELLDSGAITQQEYDAKKAQILGL